MRALLFCALAVLTGLGGPLAAQEHAHPSLPDNELLLRTPPGLTRVPLGPEYLAQQDSEAGAAGGAEQGAEAPRLDDLFAQLKREPEPDRAEAIAGRIQAEWLRSGSATIDLLIGWAAQAIAEENHGAAFDLLEQAMLLAPDYAEAWNLRATLNFQLSEYGRSLADIEQTLIREPRHFGALAGLAAILEEFGEEERALQTYRRLLEVYPTLRSAQDAVGRLSAETGGQGL